MNVYNNMLFCDIQGPINSIRELLILTELLLGEVNSDETCVSTNESQLAGLSTAVCKRSN